MWQLLIVLSLFGAVAKAQQVTLKTTSAHCGNSSECHPGNRLTVEFENLDAWIKADAKNDPSKLVLALNGQLLKGLTPDRPVAGANALQFGLIRNVNNRETWNALLSKSHWTEQMTASVAPENDTYLYGNATFTLHVFPGTGWVVAAIVSVLALLIFFVILAKQSNIIRDPAPGLPKDVDASYSLARSQMAWWMFLIVGAYIYVWMITGDLDTITQGVLILMGISAGAGLGSMVVDASKQDQRRALEAEASALTVQIANAPMLLSADDLKAAQTRLVEIASSLKKLPSTNNKSNHFILDILRDDTGVSFHRFQMAVWTLVLGIVFIIEVYKSLAMPDFSATLLGLMGISSGTYLGFKIPDQPK